MYARTLAAVDGALGACGTTSQGVSPPNPPRRCARRSPCRTSTWCPAACGCLRRTLTRSRATRRPRWLSSRRTSRPAGSRPSSCSHWCGRWAATRMMTGASALTRRSGACGRAAPIWVEACALTCGSLQLPDRCHQGSCTSVLTQANLVQRPACRPQGLCHWLASQDQHAFPRGQDGAWATHTAARTAPHGPVMVQLCACVLKQARHAAAMALPAQHAMPTAPTLQPYPLPGVRLCVRQGPRQVDPLDGDHRVQEDLARDRLQQHHRVHRGHCALHVHP